MNDLIKYALLGFGGWLLYSKFVSVQPTPTTGGGTPAPPLGAPAGTPVKPSGGTPTPVASSGINPADYCATAKKVSLAAGQGATMNADDWNYYWSQASGVTQTADLFPPGNRDAKLTFDQYLVNRQTAGVGIAIPDCVFEFTPGHEMPGPAALGNYVRPRGVGYVRRGTPMRVR